MNFNIPAARPSAAQHIAKVALESSNRLSATYDIINYYSRKRASKQWANSK